MVRLLVLIVLAFLMSQCSAPHQAGEWPHPFSPISRISLKEFVGQHVTVTVYNTLGESVGIAHDGILDSVGEVALTKFVNVTVDSTGTPDTTVVSDSSLTSGIYFYRVETPDTVFNRAWRLLK